MHSSSTVLAARWADADVRCGATVYSSVAACIYTRTLLGKRCACCTILMVAARVMREHVSACADYVLGVLLLYW